MRDLTLHEKISIKGVLSRPGGLRGSELVKLTMSTALHYWKMLHGFKPLGSYYKLKIRTPRK